MELEDLLDLLHCQTHFLYDVVCCIFRSISITHLFLCSVPLISQFFRHTWGENLEKKTRKQELDQEGDQENKKTRKKTITRPIKRSRKQELDQESDQEKRKNFLFFLINFLVEFLFSCFLTFFFSFINSRLWSVIFPVTHAARPHHQVFLSLVQGVH